jgi:hypothetical protein
MSNSSPGWWCLRGPETEGRIDTCGVGGQPPGRLVTTWKPCAEEEASPVTIVEGTDDVSTGRPRGGTAKLNHPKKAGFVSLRASVTESDSSTAQVTIYQAYRTR